MSGSVIVAASLGGTVTNVVLDTGGDAAATLKVGRLEASHASSRDSTAQEYIFTGTLGNASPRGSKGNVYHGRENPVRAGS